MSKPTGSKNKERGSTDEVEILREIIRNDPLLMEKVMDKIRNVRGLSKVGIIEQMANKPVAGETNSKKRKGRVP